MINSYADNICYIAICLLCFKLQSNMWDLKLKNMLQKDPENSEMLVVFF